MTNLPDDAPTVVPVDPASVATTASGGGPRRSGAGRFRWLLAGTAAVAGIAAVAILANTLRGPNVGATPTAPPVVSLAACTADMVTATVGQWEGAAGQRIGTVTVTNSAAKACRLSSTIRPSLIDRNGRDLIVGKAATLQPITIPAGGSVQTLVQTGNYCGPTAQEPAAVALLFTGERVIARPVAGDSSSGVPPCMGEAGPTDDITIQPWGTAQG